MPIDPRAGQPALAKDRVNVEELIRLYYEERPDFRSKEEKVTFGTSGHRGSSLKRSFNESHILAITQAICDYRKGKKIEGPLFLGIDTHALSQPAFQTALEVLAASGVDVCIDDHDDFTPSPVISFSILEHNRKNPHSLSDGMVITPSHNPPDEGGIKYDPPHGGGANAETTRWIEARANEILEKGLHTVSRIPFARALTASTTHRYHFQAPYINALSQVIDMEMIKKSKLAFGIDPLGGAGIHYWEPIANQYKLNLTLLNKTIDPTFGFMCLDWDGRIRMDPSSSYAMQSLIPFRDRFLFSAACDTDHDRHGILSKSSGLMPANHFLSAALYYLCEHRNEWKKDTQIGKTVVTTQMIDRIARHFQRKVIEVPVGFKWFAEDLFRGSMGFAGEQSAGATLARKNGSVWTTDKDGIVMALLAAEMTAKLEYDPGELYQKITRQFGSPMSRSIEIIATREQKEKVKNLQVSQISKKELAGEHLLSVSTKAIGNGAPIGGIKMITAKSWLTIRPSGTEDIIKVVAESFSGEKQLESILQEAQEILQTVLEVS